MSDTGHDDELPAWSLAAGAAAHAVRPAWWTGPIDREWAWGGSTGEGVAVAVVDRLRLTTRAPDSTAHSRPSSRAPPLPVYPGPSTRTLYRSQPGASARMIPAQAVP